MTLDGVLAVAGMFFGGVAGGSVGGVAALLWADMDLASLEPVIFAAAGTVIGAGVGAFVGASA